MVRRVNLLALCAALGCGDGDDYDVPALEIGVGQRVFQSFADGEHMRMQESPEGAYFVWLAMRAELAAGPMHVELDVVPTHPARPYHTTLALEFRPVEDASGLSEFVGHQARILGPECAVGQPVNVRAVVRDRQGNLAEGTLMFIPDPPQPGFGTVCLE
jgi:hypothetical protein